MLPKFNGDWHIEGIPLKVRYNIVERPNGTKDTTITKDSVKYNTASVDFGRRKFVLTHYFPDNERRIDMSYIFNYPSKYFKLIGSSCINGCSEEYESVSENMKINVKIRDSLCFTSNINNFDFFIKIEDHMKDNEGNVTHYTLVMDTLP